MQKNDFLRKLWQQRRKNTLNRSTPQLKGALRGADCEPSEFSEPVSSAYLHRCVLACNLRAPSVSRGSKSSELILEPEPETSDNRVDPSRNSSQRFSLWFPPALPTTCNSRSASSERVDKRLCEGSACSNPCKLRRKMDDFLRTPTRAGVEAASPFLVCPATFLPQRASPSYKPHWSRRAQISIFSTVPTPGSCDEQPLLKIMDRARIGICANTLPEHQPASAAYIYPLTSYSAIFCR
jgi:hypothetical protein